MNMKDQYNRNINYMRISITDRCNLCCTYCKGYEQLKHKDILRYEEILDICKVAVSLGIHFFKITGGEPCARKGYLSFIERLKELEGVYGVTLTTNGTLFNKEDIDALKKMKLDGMNISIDTLDREHYKRITGKDCISKVIENVVYAKKIGLYVKINSVLLDELENKEIMELIEFGNQYSIPVRFIELMPMKDEKSSHRNKEYVLSLLEDVEEDICKYGNGPAIYYRCNKGIVGFIEPVHGKFCNQCNRIRLTSAGYLKACLFHTTGRNIRNCENLEQVMKDIIVHKPKGHNFENEVVGISMSQIGG